MPLDVSISNIARADTLKLVKAPASSAASPNDDPRFLVSTVPGARASKLGPNLAIGGTGAAAKKGDNFRFIAETKARYCDKVSCAFQQAVSSIGDVYATCEVGQFPANSSCVDLKHRKKQLKLKRRSDCNKNSS